MGLVPGQAQDVDAIIEGMNVRHIGPGAMSGRVTTIDVQRDRPEVITSELRVGAFGGRSQPAWNGNRCSTMRRPKASGPRHCTVQSRCDLGGDREGNPRNSHSSGRGVYRSMMAVPRGIDGPRRHAQHPPDHRAPDRPPNRVGRRHRDGWGDSRTAAFTKPPTEAKPGRTSSTSTSALAWPI